MPDEFDIGVKMVKLVSLLFGVCTLAILIYGQAAV
jgi:phage shock protein PspC (stress-responsive transcriptional regulator)